MDVTYRPEDGEEQRWRFDPAKVRASKAEMIEKRFGESWNAWKIAVQQGSMRARRVLLWHLLSMKHPGLRFEDTPDFCDEELDVENDVAELTELRERVAKSTLSDADKEQMFVGLDLELTEAMARDEAAGVQSEGKAPSKRDGKSTP